PVLRAPDRDDASLRQPAAPPVAVPTPLPATPVPATPTAEPTATATPRREPTAVPTVQATPAVAVEAAPAATRNGVSPLAYGAAGLAAAALGGAALIARRRARRSLSEPPPPDDPIGEPLHDGFAEAELARMLAHRLHGQEADPAMLVAAQVVRFLRDEGLGHVPIVTVRQGRRTAAL